MRTVKFLSSVPALALVAACGGGDDGPSTAPLSVRITDAPAISADISRVCLAFQRITLHYAGGDEVVIEYNPTPAQVSSETHCMPEGSTWDGTSDVPPVRLSALSGSLTVALVESLQVPVGLITWIRLHVATDGSFLEEYAGGVYSMSDELLRCPSCEITDNNEGRGFKLNRNLEVTSNGLAVTIDVDLGVSLIRNANGYTLRPTARIEIDGTLGTIAGSVGPDTVSTAGGVVSDTIVETGCAVYVFPDEVAAADDYHASSPVITTARVRAVVDEISMLWTYRYAAGALVADTYAVALTCNLDDPLADNDNTGDAEGVVLFSPLQVVPVVAGQTSEANF